MTAQQRPSGRQPGELRALSFEPGFTRYAEGSVLACFGSTRVLCTASVDKGVPPFLRGKGQGWVTAEYGMLPRSTHTRMRREAAAGKQGGRTIEIQRLIGRSLRSIVDMKKLGERTIWLDCDVIQADGGTRTASITGAYVALADACKFLVKKRLLKELPMNDFVAAVSCGIVGGKALLDLDYVEDSGCETDMNFVMTGTGQFVEVQGTAEEKPFTRDQFNEMAELAEKGIGELIAIQRKVQMEG